MCTNDYLFKKDLVEFFSTAEDKAQPSSGSFLPLFMAFKLLASAGIFSNESLNTSVGLFRDASKRIHFKNEGGNSLYSSVACYYDRALYPVEASLQEVCGLICDAPDFVCTGCFLDLSAVKHTVFLEAVFCAFVEFLSREELFSPNLVPLESFYSKEGGVVFPSGFSPALQCFSYARLSYIIASLESKLGGKSLFLPESMLALAKAKKQVSALECFWTSQSALLALFFKQSKTFTNHKYSRTVSNVHDADWVVFAVSADRPSFAGVYWHTLLIKAFSIFHVSNTSFPVEFLLLPKSDVTLVNLSKVFNSVFFGDVLSQEDLLFKESLLETAWCFFQQRNSNVLSFAKALNMAKAVNK